MQVFLILTPIKYNPTVFFYIRNESRILAQKKFQQKCLLLSWLLTVIMWRDPIRQAKKWWSYRFILVGVNSNMRFFCSKNKMFIFRISYKESTFSKIYLFSLIRNWFEMLYSCAANTKIKLIPLLGLITRYFWKCRTLAICDKYFLLKYLKNTSIFKLTF